MIFFLGNITSPFIIPLISRYEGARKNTTHALYMLLGCTVFFVLVGFVLFGIFGSFTVPILYGSKAHIIVPYLLLYTFGMACYTISNVLVNYYLARKNYLFTIASTILIFFQVGLLLVFHNSVYAIVLVMTVVLFANLIVTMGLHFGLKHVESFGKYVTHLSISTLTKFHKLNFAATGGK